MLLSNPTPPSKYLKEGIVFEVDVKRSFCKVRTFDGQAMQSVTWLEEAGGSSRSGSSKAPKRGDRVIISTHLGYPFILGFKPTIYSQEVGAPNRLIENENWIEGIDTGNQSFFDNADIYTNEAAPGDRLIGDHIFSSEGGALMGVLRGGSFIAKASSLAQLFVSKIDDLVRIVSRNHEVFSDSQVDIHANIRGRQYNFKGVGKTIKDTREDRYQYMEFTGDVAAGEALKGDYVNKGPNAAGEAVDAIKREIIADYPEPGESGYNEQYDVLYSGEMNVDGSTLKIIQDGEGETGTSRDYTKDQLNNSVYTSDTSTIRNQGPEIIDDKVNGSSTYSQVLKTGDKISSDFNGVAVITQNSSGIVIEFNDQDTITLNGSSITIDRSGVSKVTLDDASAKLESGGHSIIVSSSGIVMA